jgi:predicted component of type VI protein secretion system
MNQSNRQRDATLLPARQILALALGIGQIEKFDQKVTARQKIHMWDIVETRVELERLADGEVSEQRDFLRHVADQLRRQKHKHQCLKLRWTA